MYITHQSDILLLPLLYNYYTYLAISLIGVATTQALHQCVFESRGSLNSTRVDIVVLKLHAHCFVGLSVHTMQVTKSMQFPRRLLVRIQMRESQCVKYTK